MRSKIRVSVIMPARNAARFVGEAIGSVLGQNGIDFELLAADDASTDRTWDRMRTFRENPRLRLWRFKKQKGVGAARNYLISKAKGDYLSLCDADDKMFPGFLSTLAGALERHPSVGVVYGDRWVNTPSGRLRRFRRGRWPAADWDILQGTLSNPGTMIRRSLVRKVGGYRTDLPYMEDCEWFWRLAEVTRFLHVRARPRYFYRQHPGSLSAQFKKKSHSVKLKLLREVILRRHGFRVPW